MMERKQKIELLRNIRDGRVSVKDLFQPLLQVWRQDKSNPDQPLYKFSNEVLSWQELKDRISNSNGVVKFIIVRRGDRRKEKIEN